MGSRNMCHIYSLSGFYMINLASELGVFLYRTHHLLPRVRDVQIATICSPELQPTRRRVRQVGDTFTIAEANAYLFKP
jgi:hypothetical protein